MKSVKSLKKQAIKAAQLSFKSGKLDEIITRKFIKSFKNLPLNEAVFSLNYFLQAIKMEKAKSILTVESVIKIQKSQFSKIESGFKREFKILETRQELNPSLLGGVKVRIGDVIFDNSLKAKIEQVGNILKG